MPDTHGKTLERTYIHVVEGLNFVAAMFGTMNNWFADLQNIEGAIAKQAEAVRDEDALRKAEAAALEANLEYAEAVEALGYINAAAKNQIFDDEELLPAILKDLKNLKVWGVDENTEELERIEAEITFQQPRDDVDGAALSDDGEGFW